MLLKSQFNHVFEAIKKSGLDPRDFSWSKGNESTIPGAQILTHKPSKYYFIFDQDEEGNRSIYSPGSDCPIQHVGRSSWYGQISSCKQWLSYLKRELEAPDLWSLVASAGEIALAPTTSEVENTPFTEDEQQYISTQLQEIEKYLQATREIPPDGLARIESRIEYLEDAAKRQGRIDWKNILVGQLLSIAIEAAIPPHLIQDLFRLASDAFQRLFAGIALLK